jgi:hypothetical protein
MCRESKAVAARRREREASRMAITVGRRGRGMSGFLFLPLKIGVPH